MLLLMQGLCVRHLKTQLSRAAIMGLLVWHISKAAALFDLSAFHTHKWNQFRFHNHYQPQMFCFVHSWQRKRKMWWEVLEEPTFLQDVRCLFLHFPLPFLMYIVDLPYFSFGILHCQLEGHQYKNVDEITVWSLARMLRCADSSGLWLCNGGKAVL